jgi:hypothetical protein
MTGFWCGTNSSLKGKRAEKIVTVLTHAVKRSKFNKNKNRCKTKVNSVNDATQITEYKQLVTSPIQMQNPFPGECAPLLYALCTYPHV